MLPDSESSNPQQRLFICGTDELAVQKAMRITHWISIANPGGVFSKPSWFDGEFLQLWFGDVVSEADARQCRTKAPTREDIQKALEFFRLAWHSPNSGILVSCDYGASRSPALAYVLAADRFGAGRESDALELILKIRPNAVPNRLVVQLGGEFLGRRGALLQPLKQLYSRINEEIARSMRSR